MSKTDDFILANIPLFADVPTKRRPELRRLLTSVKTAQRKEVVRQGDFGLEFLVLASGSATVVKDDEVVAELQAGDFFGESAMLTNNRRNASVIVAPNSELFASSRIEFRTMLQNFPEIAKRLELAAATRNN